MEQLRRGLSERLINAVERFPVTILEGGRAVGKSTLCRQVAATMQWTSAIDLTFPETLAQLKADPVRFLRAMPSPVLIDEAQLEPQLLLWVKLVVDERNGKPGQFLLTGSARLGRNQLGGSDPLAGRSIRLRMWPLTISELAGDPQQTTSKLFDRSYFVDRVGTVLPQTKAAKAAETTTTTTTTKGVETTEARPAWLSGGLPGIPGVRSPMPGYEWNAALSSYVESTIPLGSPTTRVDHSRLLAVFRYLAANPGQLLNVARGASELAMKADTLRSYIETLESSFLLFRTEAHRSAEHRVLTAHPRIFASDVGLASWALGLAGKNPLPLQFGSLLENLLAVELSSTAYWSHETPKLRHWRNERSQHEVDLLVVHPDGRMVPLEVKGASTVGPGDTRGLLAFAQSHPEEFVSGYVVYTGARVVDLSPKGMPDGSILGIPASLLLGQAV